MCDLNENSNFNQINHKNKSFNSFIIKNISNLTWTPKKSLNWNTSFLEIIGHLETPEGKDLGELVVINKARGRGRPKYKKKKTRYYCDICGRGFLHKGRFLMHKWVFSPKILLFQLLFHRIFSLIIFCFYLTKSYITNINMYI